MAAFGSSQSDLCSRLPLQYPSSLLTRRVIVGTFATYHFKSLCFATRGAQSKSTNAICRMEVFMTTPAMMNLMELWRTAVRIYSSPCLKCIKSGWCLATWNHKDMSDYRLSWMGIMESKTERFYIIELPILSKHFPKTSDKKCHISQPNGHN